MKRNMRILALLLAVSLILLPGCTIRLIGEGGSGGNGAHFERTGSKIDATQEVTVNGADIKLPQTSLLAGTVVSFSAAAVDRAITVSVGTVTGTYENVPETISDTALSIDLGGYRNLTQPFAVTMQYVHSAGQADMVPAALMIGDDGSMTPVITESINRDDGTFTFIGFNAGIYTYYLIDGIGVYPESGDTGFLPSVDGFSEVNEGSSLFSGGECYGMSSFSKWFYINKKSDSGGFYDKFHTPQMGVSPTGDVITPQDVIATKAFQYTTRESSILWKTEQHFSSYVTVAADGTKTYTLDNSAAVRCIMDTISFWKEPVEVGLYGSAGHSVLAYAYEITGDQVIIYIYDPNFPGDDGQKVIYNIADNTISTPSYNAGFLDKSITTTGSGTFSGVAEYQRIYEDAMNNFKGDTADLEIISPENGSQTNAGTVWVSGTLDTLSEKGEQIGDIVEIVMQEGLIYRSYLTDNGSAPSTFDINIPVMSGENKFVVNTYYYDENGNECILNNDLYGWYIINSTAPSNVIYITLTWDAQPDVDLYVTDPAGYTSYFQNTITPDGGELDIDDTTSYGPEHWTLTTADTVRWGEAYTVRLHYYDGEGPTSYSVTVTVSQGTQKSKTFSYSGVIYSSDELNYYPGSAGADWVNICTVVPVQ